MSEGAVLDLNSGVAGRFQLGSPSDTETPLRTQSNGLRSSGVRGWRGEAGGGVHDGVVEVASNAPDRENRCR